MVPLGQARLCPKPELCPVEGKSQLRTELGWKMGKFTSLPLGRSCPPVTLIKLVWVQIQTPVENRKCLCVYMNILIPKQSMASWEWRQDLGYRVMVWEWKLMLVCEAVLAYLPWKLCNP